MRQIIYKTSPRLFVLSTAFFGSIFFVLLIWLIKSSADKPYSTIIYVIMVTFSIFSLVGFYYFMSLKIVTLYTDSLRVSCMLLPFKKVFSLQEIKILTQKSRDVNVKNPNGISVSFTELKTLIELTNGKQIKLYAIGQLDYVELSKTFTKLKNGQKNFAAKKTGFKFYLMDNFGGIIWTIFFLIIVGGLFHGILTK